MRKMFWLALGVLAPVTMTLMAQEAATTVYGSATYSSAKPGRAAERRARLEKFVNVGIAGVMKADPDAMGAIALELAYPSAKEAGHDMILVTFSKKPPQFSGKLNPTFLQAMGETEQEYRAALEANRVVEKSEIWTSIYRHGGFPKGGLVRIAFVDPPMEKTVNFVEMTRELESGVRAQIVKNGARSGMHLYQLWGKTWEEPYNFVQLEVAANADELHKNLGNRIDLFREAHPGKSYGRYLDRYRESYNASKLAIYRIAQVLLR